MSRPARTGPWRDRLRLHAMRSLGVGAWLLGERLGIDVAGATEAPPVAAVGTRRKAFDAMIAASRRSDGILDARNCAYPAHELLTHLVLEHGLLLHGSNDAGLHVLEPRPARDYDTELRAVVACSDGIWPLFYATIARAHVGDVFTACAHLGRPPQLRRFYMFSICGDPSIPNAWTHGSVYALPRDSFRREWGQEWVSGKPVRPVLRVPVAPADFPLREAVLGLPDRDGFRSVSRRLRAAKRQTGERATADAEVLNLGNAPSAPSGGPIATAVRRFR